MEQIIRLKKGEFWKGFCPEGSSLKITCLEGALWITQEGDEWDYCLEKREDFETSRKGGVLVEATEPNSFLHLRRLRPKNPNQTSSTFQKPVTLIILDPSRDPFLFLSGL